MGTPKEILEPDCYYHIYNHAVGDENLFKENRNYDFFMDRVSKWLLPVAKLLSYCLMPNHFHLVAQIRSESELAHRFMKKIERKSGADSILRDLDAAPKSFISFADKARRNSSIVEKIVINQFSHCFNSYVQAFNKTYSRMGSLMKEGFQRKKIDSEDYLRKVICYVHNNPVAHGYAFSQEDWRYSSYQELISNQTVFVEKDEVIDLFDTVENFIFVHKTSVGIEID